VGVLLFVSCAVDSEKEHIKKTVKAYNIALVQSYRDVDLSYMKPFASKEQLNRLFPTIAALKSSGNIMIAVQLEHKVIKFRSDGNEATVDVFEKWKYWWENRNSGQITKPAETMEYQMIYHLKKNNGNWLVDGIENKEK
jgi:hypothetical protein